MVIFLQLSLSRRNQELDGETMEEGLLALSGSKSNINGASGSGSDVITPSGSSSSVTPVVVLSTLVALCGSFGYGCAVSDSVNLHFSHLGLFCQIYHMLG